jgi:hypothetical protein
VLYDAEEARSSLSCNPNPTAVCNINVFNLGPTRSVDPALPSLDGVPFGSNHVSLICEFNQEMYKHSTGYTIVPGPTVAIAVKNTSISDMSSQAYQSHRGGGGDDPSLKWVVNALSAQLKLNNFPLSPTVGVAVVHVNNRAATDNKGRLIVPYMKELKQWLANQPIAIVAGDFNQAVMPRDATSSSEFGAVGMSFAEPYKIFRVPEDVMAAIICPEINLVAAKISGVKTIELSPTYLNTNPGDLTFHWGIKVVVIPSDQPSGSRKRTIASIEERQIRRRNILSKLAQSQIAQPKT